MSNVAVVNVARLLDESKKGKVLAATLRTAAEKWQKELADLEKQFSDGQAKLEQLAAGNSEARAKLEREVRLLELDIRHLQAKAQLDIDSRREQAKNKVLADIEPIMKAMAQEYSLDLILSVPSQQVAYSSAAIDITDKLLEKVDAA